MSETGWVKSKDHPQYREKTLQNGAHTLRIFRPELDKAERERREAKAKAMLERTLANYYIRKEQPQ